MTFKSAFSLFVVGFASVYVAISFDKTIQSHQLRQAAYRLSETCDNKPLAMQLAVKSAELAPMFNYAVPLEVAMSKDC